MIARLHRPPSARSVVTAVFVIALALAGAACGSDDPTTDVTNVTDVTDGSTDGTGSSGDSSGGASTAPLAVRFESVRVQVTDADGVSCGLCMWLADNENLRRQGLMGVMDLEGAQGMLFTFDTPTSGGFWMKDTLISLDVAFYDTAGDFVGTKSMEPCPPDEPDCPIYRAPGEYAYAIEVPAGRAAVYGMERGGRISLDGPCDPASTVTAPTTATTTTSVP